MPSQLYSAAFDGLHIVWMVYSGINRFNSTERVRNSCLVVASLWKHTPLWARLQPNVKILSTPGWKCWLMSPKKRLVHLAHEAKKITTRIPTALFPPIVSSYITYTHIPYSLVVPFTFPGFFENWKKSLAFLFVRWLATITAHLAISTATGRL